MFEFPSVFRDSDDMWTNADGTQVALTDLNAEQRAEIQRLLLQNGDAVRAAHRKSIGPNARRDEVSEDLSKLLQVFDSLKDPDNEVVQNSRMMRRLHELDEKERIADAATDAALREMLEPVVRFYGFYHDYYEWRLGAPAHVYIREEDGIGEVSIRYLVRQLEQARVLFTVDTAAAAAELLKRLTADDRAGRRTSISEPLVVVASSIDDDLRAILTKGRTEKIHVLYVANDRVPAEVRAVAVNFKKLRSVDDMDGLDADAS